MRTAKKKRKHAETQRSESTAHTCSICGRKLPAGNPAASCPVCLLRTVLDPDYNADCLTNEGNLAEPSIGAAEARPRRFGHYEIQTRPDGSLHELGHGAMGITFKAIDVNLRIPVALKVLNLRLFQEALARRRFLREARAAASVRHPNVASVYHLGSRGYEIFYAMEFVEGESLEHLIERSGRLEVKLALEIAIQVAAGLTAVHKEHLVHRDIKPSNIIVCSEPGGIATAKIIDLGLAKAIDETHSETAISTLGAFAGTPAFASPEQFAGVGVDIRSDLYSLGATLWKMLTGQTPFRGTPAELMYRHLHAALAIGELDQVPQPVVVLLEVLLEKDPSRRFQNPHELLKAMPTIADCIRAGRTITRQSLHKMPADFSSVLTHKPKLYGRDAEREALLSTFDRVVASGIPELVLVSGYSGIGKSSVVNELHKVIVLPRGIFISGKFDQHKRDIPYATLAHAFQGLVHQILSKSEEEVGHWRDAIRESVGINGQLMVNLIPVLELVIGKQRPVPEIPPQDAQNRFQLVFRRFLSAFARPEHPLALFLDDLQWLDTATLELLEHLITEPEVRHLLVVGAYRDNEVSPSHPLMRTLDLIRKAGANIREIMLAPLVVDDVSRLVADSLHCKQDSARPLAQLVHEKSGGNPFFAIQFLTALAEEGLLVFDSGTAAWSWDLARIRAKGYTDNVVDFMAGKLNRLAGTTQVALGQLACLGNVAEIATLALVRAESEEEIHAALWEAVRAGLVFRLDSAYTFFHDRVQEAAYKLIPESELAAVHLRIGRLLAARTAPEEIEEKIFEIVNQLDRGTELIHSLDERERVAELNLIAGKRAKAATAYASALTYFAAGSALLADYSWEQRYALTFALEFHRAECEFLTGDFAAAEERLLMLSRRAGDLADSAAVTRLQTELYTTLDRSDRAVEAGLDYLRRIGVDWSPHPTHEEVRQEYERIWRQLVNRPIEALLDLPPMTDPACRATLDVLTAVEEPAHFTDQNLRCLVVARIVNLSLDHGNSDGSCVAYVQLGWFVGPRFGDYQAAFHFGKLGLDLMEKRGLERFRARVSQCFGYFVNPWSRHLSTSLELLRRSFTTAQEAGDLKYAVYSCDRLVTFLLAAGEPLGDVQREAQKGLEFARKAKFGYVVDTIVGQLRLIQTLRGLTPSFSSFNDAEFDEGRFEQHLEADPHLVFARCWYWIRKLQARFYAGDYASALTAASKAEPLVQARAYGSIPLTIETSQGVAVEQPLEAGMEVYPRKGLFEASEYVFYDALARAAQYDSVSSEQRPRYLEALAAHHKQIELWAENCPENFGNRAALVAAEIARIEGRELDAERLYEKAIQSAREHDFVQNEAIAHEIAARFYSARGFETIAHAYLRNARYCYLRWGGLGKVRQLDQCYPFIAEQASLYPAVRVDAPAGQLDLEVLTKALEAASGEIVLEKLIQALITIAVEHAGAERGILVVRRGEEHRIEAEARSGPDRIEVQLRQALVTPSELPESLFRYVIRTHQSVILEDASSQSLFSEDPYVIQRCPRSVLCLPLVKQAKLLGVLYLEHNLAPNVFTADRLSLLELLASQAAISLDHARLYADLVQLNAELRQENSDLRKGKEELHRSHVFLAQGQK